MDEPNHFVVAHRWAWEQKHGPIPNGKILRHDCDNPACCRPKHLRLGTQSDNVQDAIERGRWGKSGPRLSRETVRAIYADYATGNYLQRELAEKYNMTPRRMKRILAGISYSEYGLTPPPLPGRGRWRSPQEAVA